MVSEDWRKTVLDAASYVRLNVSDTFAFATADVEMCMTEDLECMAQIIERYGRDALVAYVAVKRGVEPIDCRCHHKNPRYQAAKAEIEALRVANSDFMEGE